MPRILVIDDAEDILEIIKLDLEDDPSCTVDCCNTSKAALNLVQAHFYDVIVADWRMPVLNGTALTKALRAAGCTSFIIIYSGKTMGPEIREALDSGADYYVNRCGDPDREFAEIKAVIRKHTARDGKTD
ncbi:MAG: response regulator [Methanoregula sp.]|jgi:DNA-binding response OmpR family regulator|nr:response regulator [Methanoregula sp.]MDD5186585.1 response regulator [Methanoregula sp.]